MTRITHIDDTVADQWVPYQDTTDVDDSIQFSDTNELIGSCYMCSGRAFASLNIEGFGGGEADAQASYMVLDYAAMRGKEVDGVKKKYGFGIRITARVTTANVKANMNVTGVVASTELGAAETDVRCYFLGLSSPRLRIPDVTNLDVSGFSQLMGIKKQVEDMLSLRDEEVIKLNPTLMMIARPAPPAPDGNEILEDSYRLLAVRGIGKGAGRKAWKDYITGPKSTRKLKDPVLFGQIVDGTYELFGITDDSTPAPSQRAQALEWSDGIVASRTGSF